MQTMAGSQGNTSAGRSLPYDKYETILVRIYKLDQFPTICVTFVEANLQKLLTRQ